MYNLMSLEASSLCKSFTANITAIRFHTIVYNHMCLDAVWLCKSFAAYVTAILLLPSMYDQVSLRCPANENRPLHITQWYGFSPVCITICFLRLPDCVNSLQQIVHLWARFSFVCLTMWVLRHRDCLNRLLQTVHTWRFSPSGKAIWRLVRSPSVKIDYNIHLILHVGNTVFYILLHKKFICVYYASQDLHFKYVNQSSCVQVMYGC